MTDPLADAEARERSRCRAFVFRVLAAEFEAATWRAQTRELQRFVRHDVRTPITIMLGHAELLAEKLGNPVRSAEVIRAQSDQLAASVARLVELPEVAPPPVVWVRARPDDRVWARATLSGLGAWVLDDDQEGWPGPGEPCIVAERSSDGRALLAAVIGARAPKT